MEMRVLISSVLFGLFAFFIWFMRENFPFTPFLILTISAVLMYAVIQFRVWRKLTDRMLADNNRAYWQGRQEAENEFNQKLREYVSKN